MKYDSGLEKETNNLQDRVVLIVNGLSESGHLLANMLSKQGADVVIAGFENTPELRQSILQDVEANGRCCLILDSNRLRGAEKSFSQQAMRKIVDTFGRLDAFVTYSIGQGTEQPERGTSSSKAKHPTSSAYPLRSTRPDQSRH